MSDEPSNEAANSIVGVAFPPTQWSMVRRVQHEGAEVEGAMNDFCRRYWQPIYSFVRGKGFGRPDAQDITQSFFMKAVTGGLVQNADQARGRLRSFLLGAMERHLADHLRHENAVKRGGRAIVLPLECGDAEERFAKETADYRDPESLFLAAWARALLDRVQDMVRDHYHKSGRGKMFDALQPFLSLDDRATPYADLAAQLGEKEAALRLNVFRMRKRFGKLLREEVSQTVETEEELREELDWLAKTLRGDG